MVTEVFEFIGSNGDCQGIHKDDTMADLSPEILLNELL